MDDLDRRIINGLQGGFQDFVDVGGSHLGVLGAGDQAHGDQLTHAAVPAGLELAHPPQQGGFEGLVDLFQGGSTQVLGSQLTHLDHRGGQQPVAVAEVVAKGRHADVRGGSQLAHRYPSPIGLEQTGDHPTGQLQPTILVPFIA